MRRALALLLLFACPLAHGAAAVVQSNSNQNAFAEGTWTVTLTTARVSGNAVIVELGLRETASGSPAATSVTDSDGNTYTEIERVADGNYGNVEFWWSSSIAAKTGTDTITATSSSCTACEATVVAQQVSGLSGVVDEYASYSSDPATTGATVTLGSATAASGEFVAAMMNTAQSGGSNSLTYPPGNNSVGVTFTGSADFVPASNGNNITAGYKITTSTETSSAAWTYSSTQGANAMIMAFKASGGGSSCTHAGWTVPGGTFSVPTSGSTAVYLASGGVGTVNCSSTSYYQQSGSFGVN